MDKKDNAKLTISIVAYHNYDDILNAVESIEKHTSKNISKHIYIVDNSCNATDSDERKHFENELMKYSDVQYLDIGENVGFGKGHNYVLKDLASEFHAIVNPDIVLEEDAFATILEFMQDTNIGMCIPRLVDEDGELQAVYRRELTVWDMFIRMFLKKFFIKRQNYHTMQDMDYTKPFQVPFGQGSFLVIRTSLLQELKGFDDRYFMYMEDADLCKRVNQVSKLMYCPDATVIHKWERGSHKSKRLFAIHVKSMFAYFGKWGFR